MDRPRDTTNAGDADRPDASGAEQPPVHAGVAGPAAVEPTAVEPTAVEPATDGPPPRPLWIERVVLTGFRNYDRACVEAGPSPVVLTGPNGAGKTNLLEAISMLAPGQGLRGADLGSLARHETAQTGGPSQAGLAWAVSGRIHTATGAHDIGTGLAPASGARGRPGRIVRIDGEPQSGSGALADVVEMVWLTPAMDGLFTGPASDRRRFLDRLILCFDPGYRTRVGQFERAMRQRNRLLEEDSGRSRQLAGLEQVMAETGVAIAAARSEVVAHLTATIEARRVREGHSLFPWSVLALEGQLETALAKAPAVEVEDSYMRALASTRNRDRAAGRTLDGPHRSDLVVRHGPKAMPAALCSTGEQKALLVGLILAHAEMLGRRRDGAPPILLLDEIAAHLDAGRRAALFAEILRLGAQCWMTGTDRVAFAALDGRARFLAIEQGRVEVAA